MQTKRPEPVDVFLREARRSLRAGRIVFLDRVLSDLSRLGITKTEAVDILIYLAPSHLHKGPEADRNMPGEIWVFDYHSDVHGQLYIKLKPSPRLKGGYSAYRFMNGGWAPDETRGRKCTIGADRSVRSAKR